MDDKNIQLMDSLMQELVQTEEWENIKTKNPGVAAAARELRALLQKLEGIVPHRLVMEIEDAVCSCTSANDFAAILYGIRVAEAIRDVSARPNDLNLHIMRRTGRAPAI